MGHQRGAKTNTQASFFYFLFFSPLSFGGCLDSPSNLNGAGVFAQHQVVTAPIQQVPCMTIPTQGENASTEGTFSETGGQELEPGTFKCEIRHMQAINYLNKLLRAAAVLSLAAFWQRSG